MLRKRYAHSDVISIHSLVKRETIEKYGYPVISKISIHSLVKRETVWQFLTLKKTPFQSTPS